MTFKVMLSACFLAVALGACSSSNTAPDETGDTTGTDTAGTTGGTTGLSTGSTTEGTTAGGTNLNDGFYVVDVFVNPNLGPECEAADGELTVANNVITGFVAGGPGADGRLDIAGEIQADGSITGGFAFSSGAAYASYTGLVTSSGQFEGDWEDQFGCSGTWDALRI